MVTSVDLRELAIDRGGSGLPRVRTRQQILTRYVLPILLILGLWSLIVWASWEIVFPPHPVRVISVVSSTSNVQRKGTPLFKAAGWIEPRPTPVRVAALAPGVVKRLLVVEDQAVHTGEPIAELVKEDAQLKYEGALADLQLREAELEESRASLAAAVTRLEKPVHLQAALGEADAMLAKIETQLENLPFETRRAVANLEAARKNYTGKVSARDVIAGIKIDIAKGELDSATALVDELKNRVDALERERAALTQRRDALRTQLELLVDEIKARDEAKARVKAAEARVEQVRVAVAETRLQLDRMTILAPIDGRIFRLIAHPGARIGGGANQMAGYDGSTVVTMYDPKMLQVRVDVRFEDIPKVRLDQPVEIDNPALSAPLTGRVLFVSSEADIQKNTLQVKVEIPEPPHVFKPEMLVDVTFLMPEEHTPSAQPSQMLRLFLPQQVIHEDNGTFVWVADQSEGIARKLPVQTGASGANGLVEVKRGLTVASRIISDGVNGLTDRARIRVTGEDPLLGLPAATSRRDRSQSLNRLPSGENQHAPH